MKPRSREKVESIQRLTDGQLYIVPKSLSFSHSYYFSNSQYCSYTYSLSLSFFIFISLLHHFYFSFTIVIITFYTLFIFLYIIPSSYLNSYHHFLSMYSTTLIEFNTQYKHRLYHSFLKISIISNNILMYQIVIFVSIQDNIHILY